MTAVCLFDCLTVWLSETNNNNDGNENENGKPVPLTLEISKLIQLLLLLTWKFANEIGQIIVNSAIGFRVHKPEIIDEHFYVNKLAKHVQPTFSPGPDPLLHTPWSLPPPICPATLTPSIDNA